MCQSLLTSNHKHDIRLNNKVKKRWKFSLIIRQYQTYTPTPSGCPITACVPQVESITVHFLLLCNDDWYLFSNCVKVTSFCCIIKYEVMRNKPETHTNTTASFHHFQLSSIPTGQTKIATKCHSHPKELLKIPDTPDTHKHEEALFKCWGGNNHFQGSV